MNDVRELLEAAAGRPEPGDLLTRVRRVAARRTRMRRGAVVCAALLLAGGVGAGSSLLAQSGRPLQPAVLAPASPATSSPAVDDVALCDRSDLTVGKPNAVHVLAGEDGVDLPITVTGGCQLPVKAFGFTPDAAVPVATQARPPTVFIPGSTVHLVLTGESDGYCVTVPHADKVAVSFRGSPLAALALPGLGLCGQIAADLQLEADHGEETSCTAAHLVARASVTSDGDVAVLLRNNADYDCYLQGTPTGAAGITATGRVFDLGLAGGVINSLSLAPGAQAQIDVGGPPRPGCLRPTGSDVFTSLRLTLLNAGGAEVTATPPASFTFACDQASISGYAIVPATDSASAAPTSPPPPGQIAVQGPTLTVSPMSGSVGATLTVSGTVSPVSSCPLVRISTGADGASGAAVDIVTVPVAGPASGLGTFSGYVTIPAARPDENPTENPGVVRAYCETLDRSATNTGANPEVDITRTK